MRTTQLIIATTAFVLSCTPQTPQTTVQKEGLKVNPLTSEQLAAEATDFRSYWNRGLAEMNRYELTQTRYGQSHSGETVAIFVTEDFLTDKQVKYEFGPKDNAVPILKMNRHSRFYTGMYPYNVNTSVFFPVDAPKPEKLVFAATEWCGQVFAQFNKGELDYSVRSFSYFQAEADQEFRLEDAPFEDALWVQLRKDPASLPTGDFKMVPGVQFLRFMHKETRTYDAKAVLETNQSLAGWDAPVSRYSVTYPELQRTFQLYFEPKFPFRIVGFEDGYAPLFRRDGKTPENMVSRGVLTNSIMLDYWMKNAKSDAAYRDALGLQKM